MLALPLLRVRVAMVLANFIAVHPSILENEEERQTCGVVRSLRFFMEEFNGKAEPPPHPQRVFMLFLVPSSLFPSKNGPNAGCKKNQMTDAEGGATPLLHFQFQFVSDLHLEVEGALSRIPEIPVKAPYLALLGNIGIYP